MLESSEVLTTYCEHLLMIPIVAVRYMKHT